MGRGQPAERERGELLMADYLTTDTELTSIANAIRTKGMTSAPLAYPDEFIGAIYDLPSLAACAIAICGSGSGSTWTTVGSSSTAACIAQTDYSFFDDLDGVFTCRKAGTYIIDYYVRGAYNSSGTAINAYFRIYQNSTIVDSVESGTIYRNAGGTGTVLVTLAEGDTLYAQQRSSSGTTTTTFAMIVKPTYL